MSGKPVFWTKDRIDQLKKLWGDGLTGPQIAKEMGAKSRNAVIGAVHRYGLPGRKEDRPRPAGRPIEAPKGRLTAFIAPTGYGGRKGRPDKGGQITAAAGKPRSDYIFGQPNTIKAWEPPPLTSDQKDFILGQGKSLLDFDDLPTNPIYCRWPINEPSRGGEYLFCGSPTLNGCPYCDAHARQSLTEEGWKRTVATRRGRAA